MAWGKAGSTTLTVAGDSYELLITSSKFFQILDHTIPSGTTGQQINFNNDTTTSYALRYSGNGGTDGTGTSRSGINHEWDQTRLDRFVMDYWSDISGEETLGISFSVYNDSAGAGTAPSRFEEVWKWDDTSQVSEIDMINPAAGDFAADSNLTVLGSDITPAAAVPALGANLQVGSRYEETDTRKMYSLDQNTVGDMTYDSKSFSVSSQETSPSSINFKSDGTKMYVGGYGTDTIYQYSLSTAWDISTASYDSVSFSLSSQDTTPYDVIFKSDRTKIYVVGGQNDNVYQYSLSTAWDLSTASYDSVSFDVSSQDTTPTGLAFSSDYTKMYVGGATNDSVFQYTLSTAGNVSTASYDSISLDLTGIESVPAIIEFNSDGTKLLVGGSGSDTIYQYSLSTAWNLSTASYIQSSFDVSSQDTSPWSVRLSADESKLYLVGVTNDTVYQYTINLNQKSWQEIGA